MATGFCKSITIKISILVVFVLFVIFEIVAIGYGAGRLRSCNTDVGLYLALTGALGIFLVIEQGHKWVYIYASMLIPIKIDSVSDPISIDDFNQIAIANKENASVEGGYLISEPSSSETTRKIDRFLAYELRYVLWIVDIIEWIFLLAWQIYGLVLINGVNLSLCDNSLYYIACIQVGLHFAILTILIITTVYDAVNLKLRVDKVMKNKNPVSFSTTTTDK